MSRKFIIFILAVQSQSVIVINNITVGYNEKYSNLSVAVLNGNSVDASFHLFAAITKMKIQIQFNVPLDESDQLFQKEIFRTTLDFERMMRGQQGNFIIKVVMENFFKSANFQPKLPMVPGIYNITNWMFDDTFIPIFTKTKAAYEARHIGKVEGVKSTVHLFTLKAFFEIDRSLN